MPAVYEIRVEGATGTGSDVAAVAVVPADGKPLTVLRVRASGGSQVELCRYAQALTGEPREGEAATASVYKYDSASPSLAAAVYDCCAYTISGHGEETFDELISSGTSAVFAPLAPLVVAPGETLTLCLTANGCWTLDASITVQEG